MSRYNPLLDASTGRTYTPRDYGRLLMDANLGWAKEIADYYVGFVKLTDPGSFPDVDVYAEKGSGVPTVVGAPLANLTPGQVVAASTTFFTRDGDGNQEDITNNAEHVGGRDAVADQGRDQGTMPVGVGGQPARGGVGLGEQIFRAVPVTGAAGY